jgi:hypothetical protein
MLQAQDFHTPGAGTIKHDREQFRMENWLAARSGQNVRINVRLGNSWLLYGKSFHHLIW